MKSRARKPKPRKDQVEGLFAAAEYFEDCGQMQAAFFCLLAGAEAGDESSQINLGNFYSEGTGVRKNLKKAAFWYRKAYNNQSRGIRSSSAAVNLGINFRNSGDLKAAIRWFERARKLQDGSACLELARIHSAHKGGRRKAMVLLQEVIELDNNFSTDADKEAAEAMLKVLSLH
jgi:TPR repeat protein